MNRLDFDYPFDLVDTITALLGDMNDDYPVISVYGKYDVIKDVLEDLIASGISIANEIELQDYDVAHYDKEFVLYLTTDGVNVEKIWHEDVYYYGSADISFIHEDCNSKLIKYVDSKTVYEFGYNEDECDCDCEECDCCDDEYDDEYEGYTVNGVHVSKAEFDRYVSQFKADEKPVSKSTKSSYTINGESVTKEQFDKKYEEFEEMYMDNIRDMLLSYCEFMDEVNEWKRLLRW